MLMLKRLLRSEKMSQKDLAAQLGIDEASMSLIVNGRRDMSIEMRKAIDALFGADKVAQFDIQPITQPTQVQATIYSSGVKDDLREELCSEYSQPKPEDAEVIEPLEAIPVITTDQAKAPGIDVKELVLSGSSEVKRLSIWEFFEKFGEFDAICPTYRDSMIPTYVPGDFLFIKYKQVTNDSYIKQGRYLLDTREHGSILCIVEDTEDGWLTLSFKNARKYKPMRIKKEDVMSIADIVLMVRMGDMAFETVDIGSLQMQLDKKDMQIDSLFAQLGSLTNQMDKQGDRTNRVIDQIEDALEQNKRLVNLMTENYLKKK